MNKLLYALMAGALVFTSCDDDFLNQAPKLDQSTEITLSNLEGIQKATIGMYAPLSSAYWYGADFITMCEMRAGNARIPKDTKHQSGRLTVEYNWNYSSGGTYGGLWTYAYYVISNANNILDNIEGKGKDEEINGIKAECLFIRALSHFDLARVYCQPYAKTDVNAQNSGVPVMLHSKIDEPARNTLKEVIDQVITDLLEAEKLMPAEYNTKANYHTEVADYAAIVSKEAIQALLSRVYLYTEQWQKASDYATKVINSGRYTMWDASSFVKAYSNAAGAGEVIFEVYGDQSNDRFKIQGWEYIQWLSNPNGDHGSGDFGASNDCRGLYAAGDVRGEFFTEADGLFWTKKYRGKGQGEPDYNNTILFRLSEMYLNRAEATIKGASSPASAAEDMAKVASNRNATAEAATAMGIFIERRKELAYEGHIIFDFARNGYALERKDTDSPVTSVEFPSYKWALPIPKGEVDANKNMVQNPGY